MSRDAWGENIRNYGVPDDDDDQAAPAQQVAQPQDEDDLSSASDPTGYVRVYVAESRKLVRVQVVEGWRAKLPPERLRDAILGAYRTAITVLPDPGSGATFGLSATPAEFDYRPHEFTGAQRSSESFQRDMDGVAEKAATALRNMPRSRSAFVQEAPTGETPIRFRLSHGWLTDCAVDTAWVVRCRASDLGHECGRALRAAEVEDAARAQEEAFAQLDRVREQVFDLMREAHARSL